MSKLLFVSDDLMLLSRLERVAQVCNSEKTVAGNSEQAVVNCDEDCQVAIIDLQAIGNDILELVAKLRVISPELSIVAAGPHVHEQKLQQAQKAGCDVVVSRGQLHRNAESIVQRLLV